jgi:biopolymer transport protein ExbD
MTRAPVFIFLLFLLGNSISAESQISVRPPAGKRSGNVVVSIDSMQQLYIGASKIEPLMLDSLLSAEITKMRSSNFDTVTVVINADTAALYGTVYHIMRVSKKNGAKVVATVK